jgi:hypothetical protein
MSVPKGGKVSQDQCKFHNDEDVEGMEGEIKGSGTQET